MTETEFPLPFKLERQIASGASSTVYEALNLDTQDRVALKVFHSKVTTDPQFFDRLEREASTLRQIRHPNIVRLIQPWTLNGSFFLELELVRGLTLKEWLEQENKSWIEPRIWILANIAKALGAVHQEQILHRDLKPENILISDQGSVKLTDFGLAKSQLMKSSLTHTGSLIGSLCYMAPETIEGRQATFASDIYSFGVIAYELLTGQHPFTDAHGQLLLPHLLASRFTSSLKASPKIPIEIGTLIDQCMSLNQADRPKSIWNVEAELLNYLHSTQLMSIARKWVESAPNDRSLSEALRSKQAQLKSEIESLNGSVGADRKKLLSRLNEYSALFPDDGEIVGAIDLLRETSPAKNRFRFLPILLLLLGTGLASISVYYFSDFSPKTPRNTLPTKADRPIPSSHQVERPIVKKGNLVILAEPGVTAYLNGIRVLRSQFAGQKLAPGQYTLLLEREGFLPIERPITLTAGKTVTINTIPERKQ